MNQATLNQRFAGLVERRGHRNGALALYIDGGHLSFITVVWTCGATGDRQSENYYSHSLGYDRARPFEDNVEDVAGLFMSLADDFVKPLREVKVGIVMRSLETVREQGEALGLSPDFLNPIAELAKQLASNALEDKGPLVLRGSIDGEARV